MERVATIVCRGCLTETDAQVVSLQVAGIRDLYESCTRLKLPDQDTDARPQNLCRRCYKRCQDWSAFKTVCHENEHIYWPLQNISGKIDHEDAIDGSGGVEEMHLQLEDDVDDLLTILGDPEEAGTSHTDNGATQVPLVKITPKIEIPGQDEAAELLSEIRDFIRNGETASNTEAKQRGPGGEDHTKSLQEIKTENESSQSITNCNDDLTNQRPICIIKEENPIINGSVSSHCALVESQDPNPKEHPEPLVISDEEDMFEIPANSEFGDFDEDLLRKVEFAELKNERFFEEITQRDSAKDNVEFWVCPACDENLINSEQYRDHLQRHLAEDSKAKEQNRAAIQERSHSSSSNQPQNVIFSRKRKAETGDENSPPSKSASSGVGLIMQQKRTTWNCPLCVECRSNRGLLVEHLRQQHRLEEGPFCPICPQNQARSPNALMKHMFLIHVDKFKCQYCFEEFSTISEFTKHIGYVHNIHRCMKRFRSCPLCHQPCRASQFQLHLTRSHQVTGEASLNCPSCAAQYDNLDGIVKHITSYHSTHYVCRLCNELFYEQVALNSHLNSHPQKQGFCWICNKQFVSKSALKQHKRKSADHKSALGMVPPPQ